MLVGFIIACAIILIWNKICDIKDYFDFRDWCDDSDIDDDDLTKESMSKFYTMWRLSKIDGVEIVAHKEDNDVVSGENKSE
jgi:hypothetical protein